MGTTGLPPYNASPTDFSSVTTVSLTFTTQKNRVKGEVITHGCSGDPLTCPCNAVVRRVQHLVTFRQPTQAPLCKYFEHHTPGMVTSTLIQNALRQSLRAIGHTTLGIHPQDIDARSLRAGCATALLCANIDHNTIQLLGRWKSDAMIRYLHIAANPQVHQHAHKMFTNGQASFAPPASQLIQPTPTPEHFLLHGEEFLMLQAKQSPLHTTQASQPCPPTASFFSQNGPLGRAG
jgi:hypothetical protein